MKLSRILRRDPAAPTLRERGAALAAGLSAAKDRAALAVKVARVVATPPEPEPKPVDRVALVNYATWLFMERRLVCAELYPNAGAKAESLIAAALAADNFHFPPGGRWQDVPKPSTRAVQILDMVGVDWRADAVAENTFDPPFFDASAPHGWPALDAALLEALDDLNRLDAGQEAMHVGGNDRSRDADTVPGYGALEQARGAALDRLAEFRAESLIGLQAKARALLTRSVVDIDGAGDDIAASLARDLLGAHQHAIEPRPDPVMVVVAEARRLLQVARDAYAIPDVDAEDPNPEKTEADDELWAYFCGPLSSTVPTTARGCTDLARYVGEFQAFYGVDLGEKYLPFLANIARSPLL